ncbi:lactate racemase domain-containing protein [Cloacibacillus sp.]|uniref:lactate racemase domain-containing protein n=1 Tax=Cloacibacillus sp. TaxID=2049023 RepID=UPI0025C48F36|nr:lactate racemase domain-containing protein [Cloacibacillus sp.]MCC8056557.1 nickel-dependent lactate racemase [Cloacibacillus sp.]
MPILLEEYLNYPLPKMHRVQQIFQKPRLENFKEKIKEEISQNEIASKIKPGARVAVAVGSRGIRNLAEIVKTVLEQIKAAGGEPFIISAMGSHGGGTPEGQRDVLSTYGITEEKMGVEIVTSVDVTPIGKTSRGINVYFDSKALSADLIVPINRVKLHTDFVTEIQSGICKMLVIGLGNHIGCTAIHEASFDVFGETLLEAAQMIMERANVGFGVAILENACDETAMIEMIPAEKIIAREKELVQVAKNYMPTLMIPDIDILIVEEIGKNISGAGYDPNILGKSYLLHEFVLSVPNIKRMVLLDVTDQSHGNAIGMGIFDVITRNVFDKLDLTQIYANAIAVKCPEDAKIPIIAETEEEALRIAVQVAREVDRDRLKIVKIKNTIELEMIEVSDALLDYVTANEKLRLL